MSDLQEVGEKEEMSESKRRAMERVRNRAFRLLSGISTGGLLRVLLSVTVAPTFPDVLLAGLLSALEAI